MKNRVEIPLVVLAILGLPIAVYAIPWTITNPEAQQEFNRFSNIYTDGVADDDVEVMIRLKIETVTHKEKNVTSDPENGRWEHDFDVIPEGGWTISNSWGCRIYESPFLIENEKKVRGYKVIVDNP